MLSIRSASLMVLPAATRRRCGADRGFTLEAVAVLGAADVGQHPHQFRHFWPKVAFDIAEGGGRIFHRVMQPGGRQHLFGVRHAAHQLHHRLWVDDVRIVGIFAALIDGRMRLGGVAARAFCKRIRHFLSLRASSA
ncbi:hypothetical protein AK51_18245 [Serratia nematodiphila DZ0503SBS1]|nr:hypothetical protein AK51_18245 [Serratia nematodiphila DZ0503SBS1]